MKVKELLTLIACDLRVVAPFKDTIEGYPCLYIGHSKTLQEAGYKWILKRKVIGIIALEESYLEIVTK